MPSELKLSSLPPQNSGLLTLSAQTVTDLMLRFTHIKKIKSEISWNKTGYVSINVILRRVRVSFL